MCENIKINWHKIGKIVLYFFLREQQGNWIEGDILHTGVSQYLPWPVIQVKPLCEIY